MNKLYKTIVGYNPSKQLVTYHRHLTYEEAIDDQLSDEAFWEVYEATDHRYEMVVGVSVGGNCYQLSPANYLSYIKENAKTMEHIHKGALLTAIATYKKKHRISFDQEW